MNAGAGLRIGVDIGGTFTDLTLVDGHADPRQRKEESTRDDPIRAIVSGLEALAAERGQPLRAMLGETRVLVHGSTIATNTVIERDGPVTALLCTEGFRDILYFRDGYKWSRFDLRLPRPRDVVERYLRIGIPERIDRDGGVVTPLDEGAVRAAAARLRRAGVESIAVAFLWSVVNPAHERRAVAILREELPDAHLVASCDVLPEIREWERTSAAALSAYILPGIAGYLTRLETTLADLGLAVRPLIMQINGGCASVAEILRRPVMALHSGPAAGPAAALFHARTRGEPDLIAMDMGGTSLDISIITGGRPAMSRGIQVEHQPVGVPGVEISAIGAGGGSIAWLDPGGALRVGPRSAGARPGPAAYGAGGEEPTVTDANVVLGYLAPSSFLGGRRALRADLARDSIGRRVAEPLGIDVERAAAGIVAVVEANMTARLRSVSVERGLDPRRFTLVSGGGAGGLHAARLARSLGIRRVLVPLEAPTFCAFGMTVTEVRHDLSRSLHARSGEIPLARLDAVFAELEAEVRARLRDEGFDGGPVRIERAVDARYPSQIHELTVPVPGGTPLDEEDLRVVDATFHAEHARRFSYSLPEIGPEFLHWRVSAFVAGEGDGEAVAEGTPTAGAGAEVAVVDERPAWSWASDAMMPTRAYRADRLPIGTTLAGPAVIEAESTTIVAHAGDTVRATERAIAIDVAAP